MKHSGKASEAALKLIGLSGAAVLALIVVALIAKFIGSIILGMIGVLIVLWALFVVFTFYFFRDSEPMVPIGKNLVLAPGHGKVDTIDTITEAEFTRPKGVPERSWLLGLGSVHDGAGLPCVLGLLRPV